MIIKCEDIEIFCKSYIQEVECIVMVVKTKRGGREDKFVGLNLAFIIRLMVRWRADMEKVDINNF